jgi:flagellar hook protein FlgE
MSINSAMLSGVSGLIANSAALGAISDNISNVNTVGYKDNSTQFEDLVASTSGGGIYNSGGVQANVSQLVTQQGQFTQTTSSTDMAVNGNGFFVVSNTAAGLSSTSGPSFTRAGSFTANSSGYLENSAGYYLQGWPASSTGVITTNPSDLSQLSTINVNDIGSSPDPSTTASLNANLNANQATSTAATTYDPTSATASMAAYDSAVAAGTSTAGTTQPDYSSQVTVYDSQGGAHTLNLDFVNLSGVTDTATSTTYPANTWGVEINSDPPGSVTSPNNNGQIASGVVTFNSDGTFKSASITPAGGTTATTYASGTPINLAVPWTAASGLTTPQSLSLNLSGAGSLTQYASTSTTNSTSVDGGPAGSFTGVTVGTNGIVTANFSNGATRTIAQVAVATFVNEDGLSSVSGNAYAQTDQSGNFTLKTAGTAGAGTVESDELEASTVDLSSEFTKLITTQNAYSAASKIITTADQMMQTLIAVQQG